MAPLYDRAPTSRLSADANGGTCSRVIDLARGGPDGPERGGITHGWSGYKAGCRCETCRAGNRAAVAQAKQRRLARREQAVFDHGASAYGNWGCRCEICRTARAEQWADWYQRRRQARRAS